MLFVSCTDDGGYSIGASSWQIKLPENYRSNLKTADTTNLNNICGIELSGEMIQLFEFQQSDAKDSLPVPNAITAFIAKRDFLQNAGLADCAKELEQMYAFMFGINNVNYEGSKEKLKIGGVDFIKINNAIYSSTGESTHGDVHFLGELDGYILHIQMSYHDENERNKLEDCVKKSRFLQ